jgi:hypothetical protein
MKTCLVTLDLVGHLITEASNFNFRFEHLMWMRKLPVYNVKIDWSVSFQHSSIDQLPPEVAIGEL